MSTLTGPVEKPTLEGYEALTLRSGSGALEATFVPRAGNVLASLRHRGAELLGRREGVAAYAGGLTTMGIPLLHPWANRLAGDRYAVAGRSVELGGLRLQRDEHGLPIHGTVNGVPWWDVRRDGEDRLRAQLEYGSRPELLAAFPFPHRVTVDVGLSDTTLTVRTLVRPTGASAVPIAFGYHPYLRLPGVPRAEWRVDLPALERLELDARGLPTGRSAPAAAWHGALGARVFDDGYRTRQPATAFSVTGGGRRITVRLDDGYDFAQVFAPADDDVLCFEPMTAPTNALVTGDALTVIGPGDVYGATFSVTVEGDGAGPGVRP
jgi:galactose mutarotase-like enzyme